MGQFQRVLQSAVRERAWVENGEKQRQMTITPNDCCGLIPGQWGRENPTLPWCGFDQRSPRGITEKDGRKVTQLTQPAEECLLRPEQLHYIANKGDKGYDQAPVLVWFHECQAINSIDCRRALPQP